MTAKQARKGHILLILLITGITSLPQTRQLDSLKKILPSLSDTLRADCLNELSYHYTFVSNKGSAVHYQSLAYEASKKLNYVHGIAEAISRQAGIFERFENDFIKEEKLATEALAWYDKTPNKKNVQLVYNQLAFSVFAQSYYERAIGYVEKTYEYYKKEGNESGVADALSFMGAIHNAKGDYDTGFDYTQQSLQHAMKTNDSALIKSALNCVGSLFLRIEDYPVALNYYRKSLERITQNDSILQARGEMDVWVQMEFAEIYCHLNLFDSALYRYNLFDSAKASEKDLRVFLVSKGEFYQMLNEHGVALKYFLSGLYYHRKLNDRNEIKRVLLDIAKAYFAMNDNRNTLNYGRQGLALSLETNSKQFIRDGYEILYLVFDRMHQTDSAYFYYRKYITMKDSVLNDKMKGKFAAYGYNQKIALLDDEKRLQQQTLKQLSLQKSFLIIITSAIILLSIVLIRYIMLKRKNEVHLREKAENELAMQKLAGEMKESLFRQQAAELEMKALRAQMNPHFIFNSLNSINRYILQNNKALASEYLTKFSRLVRIILQNSQTALISLESELEALQLYLELETVRFDHHFTFKISVEADLDISAIKVPPIIIQPYAENAIWHGLMHKEERGTLLIELYQEKDLLCCRITDDGVGRKKAAEMKSKSATVHKSIGMQITASRIEMMGHKKQLDASIKITDLVLPDGTDGGTEVLIKIPVYYD